MRALLAVLLGLAAALTVVPARAAPAPVTADDGAYVVSETFLDARTLDLTIQSPAMGGQVRTRLLLPRNWASNPTATWPTLWLLHGAGEPQDYRSWTHYTDVEAFTADKDVLVVMPSDGQAGFYTDWLFGGSARPASTPTGCSAGRPSRASGRRSTWSNCSSCSSGATAPGRTGPSPGCRSAGTAR